MLSRLEEKQLTIEISKDGTPITTSPEASIGQSVHLIVEEGLEAFLPLAGMIDYVKERVSTSYFFFLSMMSVNFAFVQRFISNINV